MDIPTRLVCAQCGKDISMDFLSVYPGTSDHVAIVLPCCHRPGGQELINTLPLAADTLARAAKLIVYYSGGKNRQTLELLRDLTLLQLKVLDAQEKYK